MYKVIITGSTGMVGKGVLLECLDHEAISSVLIVNRSSLGLEHPKLQEVLLEDFNKVENIRNQLQGYDACFYCMGISAIGLDESDYTRITYDMTKSMVDVFHDLNPDSVFVYVSGTGTDSSEQGRLMWARIKGKTENMVFAEGFRDAYAFRPGVIIPERGIRSRTGWYNTMYAITRPLFPLLKRLNSVTTTTRLGQAMIDVLLHPGEPKILENKDINKRAIGHLKNI